MYSSLIDRAARLRNGNLFRNVQFDSEKYLRQLQHPTPELCYGMFFTPCSGSSRLTAIAAADPAMGVPGECFKPMFIPKMAAKLNAPDLARYVEILRRLKRSRQCFGFRLTYSQLLRVFHTEQRMLELTKPDKCF